MTGGDLLLVRQDAQGWKVRIRPELLVQVMTNRYRIPDVTILDRVLDRDRPVAPIASYPPLAVFEVLSSHDSLQRLTRKLGDYEAMGIPESRVIDRKDATYYRYEQSQLMRKGPLSTEVFLPPWTASGTFSID